MRDPQEAAGAQGHSSLPHGMSELSDLECRAVLLRQRLCVISVVDGHAPYAVPVFYGFDGETLYVGVMNGRKTRALDSNPRVCVIVTEVARDDTWRSVIVEGTVRVLEDPAARQHAVEVLIAHNRTTARGSSAGHVAPRARHTGGRILRVEHARISGREKR